MEVLPFKIHQHVVAGPLARYCKLLVAVDVPPEPSLQLTVLPHGSCVLSLMLAAGPDPFARAPRGALPNLCGLRRTSRRYRPYGDCRTLYAQLTPEAALALTRTALPEGDDPRAPLLRWLPAKELVALEDRLATLENATDQLQALGAWIEQRMARPLLPAQAQRAARLAAHIYGTPTATIEAVASGHGLSRRQVERDFRQWLGVPPKFIGQVARAQAAIKLGLAGVSLAEAAQSLGFADQPHMTRTVKGLAHLAPAQLVRRARTAFNQPITRVPQDGLVYLGGPLAADGVSLVAN